MQVKSVKAGRSLRRATQRPMKGALELGLWAASRPEDFARANTVSGHGTDSTKISQEG